MLMFRQLIYISSFYIFLCGIYLISAVLSWFSLILICLNFIHVYESYWLCLWMHCICIVGIPLFAAVGVAVGICGLHAVGSQYLHQPRCQVSDSLSLFLCTLVISSCGNFWYLKRLIWFFMFFWDSIIHICFIDNLELSIIWERKEKATDKLSI